MDNLINLDESMQETSNEKLNKDSKNLQTAQNIFQLTNSTNPLNRLSLENSNPFDNVEKQAQFFDDPFEIILKEKNTVRSQTTCDPLVQIENLLGLHTTCKETSIAQEVNLSPINFTSPKKGGNYALVHHHSLSAKRSAFFGAREKSVIKSQEEQQNSSKSEHSSLKIGRCNSLDNPVLKQNHLLKLSFLNSANSPLNQSPDYMFHNEAKKIYDQISQNYSSPMASHENSCEDLSSVKPNFADTTSENCEFDSSFKELNIPFLENCVIKTEPEEYDEWKNGGGLSLADQLANVKVKIEKGADNSRKEPEVEKVKDTPVETSETQNMQSIISNLQHAIQEQSGSDKEEAKRMLDNLNEFLCKKGKHVKPTVEEKEPSVTNVLAPPVPMVRQDTFEIDEQPVDDRPSPVKTPVLQESVLEQITKLLGTTNLNLLQANGSPAGNNSNPTIIVVVPQTAIECVTPVKSGNNTKVRRSMSLSLDQKPMAAIKAVQNKNYNITPVKTVRRNSISITPRPRNLQTQENVRRSFMPDCVKKSVISSPLPRISISAAADGAAKLKKLSGVTTPSMPGTNQSHLSSFRPKSAPLKKSPRRPGPLKATHPLKKIVEPFSPNHNTVPRNILKPFTPGKKLIPLPRSPSLMKKPRVSFATPNMKPTVSAVQQRRRSLTNDGSTGHVGVSKLQIPGRVSGVFNNLRHKENRP